MAVVVFKLHSLIPKSSTNCQILSNYRASSECSVENAKKHQTVFYHITRPSLVGPRVGKCCDPPKPPPVSHTHSQTHTQTASYIRQVKHFFKNRNDKIRYIFRSRGGRHRAYDRANQSSERATVQSGS